MTSPQSVPLPAEDNTNHFNSPSAYAATPNNRSSRTDDESTPQTIQAKAPFTQPNLSHHNPSNLFQSLSTPTPGLLPFHVLTPKDMATPMGRPSRRGGKYHPGAAPKTEARRRNRDEMVYNTSDISGTESTSGLDEFTSEGDEFDNDDYDNFDQTIALNLTTPIQPRLRSQPYSTRSRRTAGRVSPSRTVGKTPRGKSVYEETISSFEANATSFMNPNTLSSMFAEENTPPFPCLSAASPQKLNSIHGTPGINPYQLSVDNSLLSTQLREKEAKIRQLEEMLFSQTQDISEFVDFSPEKKMKSTMATSDDLQLTVKKRRSPTKLPPSTIRKTRNATRGSSRSPVRSFAGLFEEIANGTPTKIPKVTAEERKLERRRRETIEFREFSAIDLESLKSYLPPLVVEEVAEEDVKVEQKPEDKHQNVSSTQKDERDQMQDVEPKDQTNVTLEPPKAQLDIQSSPVRRFRIRRSNSAPPPPGPVKLVVQESTTPDPEIAEMSSTIAALQAQVAQLQEELEVTSVQLQKSVVNLEGERRARIAAEETWRFLEIEKKFGVCCQFAAGSGKTEPEAAAHVPLPSSPTNSVASHSTFDGRDRYESRPGSRMQYDRPSNRLGGYSSKIATTTAMSRKRGREEGPQPQNAAKKPPIPRQEKRVLTGAGPAAANVMLGSGAVNSGLKKPTAGTGMGAPPVKGPMRATTGAAGATRSQMGLSRGARR
ncbi:hypothetical protein L873DRAFT_18330 [Choiromyces venosus 120613-1]|uniref:Uncharacterized protein n=1 Tax=Choiromyces venosus 120613-1 TaxID=1336337 RepID=A0A3N4K683_9PEZI|nr:hypothetical protein L873DRAFT_18330 [Choiromyces venosus 120613-1]